MAFSGFGTAHNALRPLSAAETGRVRLVAALLPLAVCLLWAAAVRLPFYNASSVDEYFYSIVADTWLRGGVPYVDAFDIKPPGLFFVFAMAQAIFGMSYATFKGIEIVAVGIGAWSLYGMLSEHATRRMAVWVAVLYPIYTLPYFGTSAVNVLLQLPLIVLGFSAVLSSTAEGRPIARRLLAGFLAGAAMGAAGMIKQTAVFEALAAFILLAVYSEPSTRLRALVLFVVGAALPGLAFSAYFFAVGHFREMFDAVIVDALNRIGGDVVAGYGPTLAHYLTWYGAIENSFLRSLSLTFLWGGAVFLLLRLPRVRAAVPDRVLVFAGTWLVLAFVGVVFARLLVQYYLLAIVPPLLIIAGALCCHGLDVAESRKNVAFWTSVVIATLAIAFTQHHEIFGRETLDIDNDLTARTAADILALDPKPDDRLLAVNRGTELLMATGLRPPGPFFHGTHLMSAFSTPVDNPLTVALSENPRFIVLADPEYRIVFEKLERYRQVEDYLAAHYRLAAVEKGLVDSYSVYEFVD